MTIGIIVIVIVVLIALWFINQSNQLNRYQVSIEESKKNIDIILVKRYDTISEMLKVAKSYAKQYLQSLLHYVKVVQFKKQIKF